MQQIQAGERVFEFLRRLRPSQRVIQIAVCRAIVPALEAVGDVRATVLAEVITTVCSRFDSRGRLVR